MAANPGLATQTARTFAAWVNLTSTSLGDSTIFNGSSLNHANAHFQVQGNGKIRFTSRQESTNTNLFDFPGNVFVNQPAVDGGAVGQTWPVNEWHHVAVTADINANGGAGEAKMYFDGQLLMTVPKIAAATETVLPIWQTHGFNDFYDGLALGCVYDSGSRRTNGLLDEAYLFTRALTAAEVLTLYNIPAPGVPADYNGNGVVDGPDYVVWRNGGPLLNEVDLPGTVNAADYTAWRARFGNISGSGLGSGGAVPEPASLGVLLVCLGILAGRRRLDR